MVQVRWYYNEYSSGIGGDDERRPFVASTTTSRGRATEIGSGGSSSAFRTESASLVCPLLIAALVRRVMLVVY